MFAYKAEQRNPPPHWQHVTKRGRDPGNDPWLKDPEVTKMLEQFQRASVLVCSRRSRWESHKANKIFFWGGGHEMLRVKAPFIKYQI